MHPHFYRPDMDGLRALAVLLVVLFHYFPFALPAGFVGVDIFFVISGFLIANIIFNNLNQNTFSFLYFYSRRIQRIFPSLILILFFSFICGYFLFFNDDFALLNKHILSGTLFISNFVLLNESGYFDKISELKPLLHLWSLGIEEQFYIFFPFLLYFLNQKHFKSFNILILLFLFSFFIHFQYNASKPIHSFYLPFTRIWELLAGAILARFLLGGGISQKFLLKINNLLNFTLFDPPQFHRKIIHHCFSFLGLFLIFLSLLFIHPQTFFPHYWALFPISGSLFIILAGQNAYFNQHFLSHKIMVFIGKNSYAFYLWHWPILCFSKIYYGGSIPRLDRLILLFCAFILSYLTTRFVENPLRFGKYKRFKIIILIFLLVLLSFISSLVYFYLEKEKNDFYSQEWIQSWGKWRHFGNQNASQRIVLMGDSHAAHFEKQLIDKIGKHYAIDRIAGPCLVGKNQVKLAWEMPAQLCQNMQQNILQTAVPDVAIVAYYLRGNKKIESQEDFKNYVLDEIALFNPPPKKMIFVGDPGNIDVVCEAANQSKLLKNKKKCAPPYSIESYLNFKKWSQNQTFPPFVHFVYPFEMLCDESGHCQAYGKHGKNFWDDNHLTYWGSEPVAQKIADIILKK